MWIHDPVRMILICLDFIPDPLSRNCDSRAHAFDPDPMQGKVCRLITDPIYHQRIFYIRRIVSLIVFII